VRPCAQHGVAAQASAGVRASVSGGTFNMNSRNRPL